VDEEELPILIMIGPLELGPVATGVVVRIETLNSIWILDGACYVRLPKGGEAGSRRSEDRARMVDGKRHSYLSASWVLWPDGSHVIRIRPDPPVGRGEGILTSVVIAVDGQPVDKALPLPWRRRAVAAEAQPLSLGGVVPIGITPFGTTSRSVIPVS
jgi:hypothetical protein